MNRRGLSIRPSIQASKQPRGHEDGLAPEPEPGPAGHRPPSRGSPRETPESRAEVRLQGVFERGAAKEAEFVLGHPEVAQDRGGQRRGRLHGLRTPGERPQEDARRPQQRRLAPGLARPRGERGEASGAATSGATPPSTESRSGRRNGPSQP